MKTRASIIAGLALITVSAGQASAADLRGSQGGDIPYAVAQNWAGPYAGVAAGYTEANADFAGYSVSSSDTTVAVFAGYNWQRANQVYGVEGEVGNDYISLRGRYGMLFDNWLVYGTAGVAFGESVDVSAYGYHYGNNPTGFVVGGGTETEIGHNLTAGVEGLYYWFGNEQVGPYDVNVDAFSIRARLAYHFDTDPLK